MKSYNCGIVDKNCFSTKENKEIFLPETPQIGAFVRQDDIAYAVIGIEYTGGEHSGYIKLILKIL